MVNTATEKLSSVYGIHCMHPKELLISEEPILVTPLGDPRREQEIDPLVLVLLVLVLYLLLMVLEKENQLG